MITPGDNPNEGQIGDATERAEPELKSCTGIASQDETHYSLSDGDKRDLNDAQRAVKFLDQIRKSVKDDTAEFDIDDYRLQQRDSMKQLSQNQETPGGVTLNSDMDRLGRFTMLKLVGQGGFAKVFRAHDSILKRDVALKVPKPHVLMSEESALRFKREAEAAAILSHPSIVPVFEAGAFGPIAYIASEYFPGQNLEGWQKDNRKSLDFQTSAKIVAELADALHHAHQRGILHRDLKPGNILVANGIQDISRRLRVTDFGLAKQIDSEANLTTAGAIVGTPAYMSPEQARAEVSLGPTSDIYSLGVILYELLTGRLPCIGKNHLSTIKLIEEGKFDAPRKLNQRIPRDLESICLKCLAHRSDERYQSCFQLNRDLHAWIDGRPVSARRISTVTRFVRWTRSNQLLSAALTFAFCSLALGFALTAWKWNESNKNLTESIAQTRRAERHVNLAQTTIDQVIGQVTKELQDSPEFSGLRTEIVTKVVELQEKLLADEPQNDFIRLETAQAYLDLAHLELQLGKFSRVPETLRRFESVIAPDAPWTGEPRVDKSRMRIYARRLQAVNYRKTFQTTRANKALDDLIADLHLGNGEIDEDNRNRELLGCLLEKSVVAEKSDVAEIVAEALAIIKKSDWDDWQARVSEAGLLFQLGYARASLDSSCYKTAFDPALEKTRELLLEDEESLEAQFLLLRIKALYGYYARKENDLEVGVESLKKSVEMVTELKNKLPDYGIYADKYFKYSTFLVQTLIKADRRDEANEVRKEIAKAYSELNPDLILAEDTISRTALALVRLAVDVCEKGEDPMPYLENGMKLFKSLHGKQLGWERLRFVCYESYAIATHKIGEHEESLRHALIAESYLAGMHQPMIRGERVGEFYQLYCSELIRAHEFVDIPQAIKRMKNCIRLREERVQPDLSAAIVNLETAKVYSAMVAALEAIMDDEVTRDFDEAMREQWVQLAVAHIERAAKSNLKWTQDEILGDADAGLLPEILEIARPILGKTNTSDR